MEFNFTGTRLCTPPSPPPRLIRQAERLSAARPPSRNAASLCCEPEHRITGPSLLLWQIPQGSPCDHRRHLGNSKSSDLTEPSLSEQTCICNRCERPRNFGHVEDLVCSAPFRFCSAHIVQGLTRICISARLACYCQEGAKHRRKESRWVSKKWIVVETDFPCFHFGFLITLPS